MAKPTATRQRQRPVAGSSNLTPVKDETTMMKATGSTRILALSSSRVGAGGYLEAAALVIQKFLGLAPLAVAFVPFASVDDYDDYAKKVREALSALPYSIKPVTPQNAKVTLEQCDAVMIGGGNTFKLLHDLYELNLIEAVKAKVQSGTPYIGWSAGSNLCGPTICTTNDMPVIQPESFKAFHFFPFQINPHYHNAVINGFHGETRDRSEERRVGKECRYRR